MKIKFKEGRKCEGDTLLSIETNGEEIITLIDLAYYINVLGINELKIIENNPRLNKNVHFWFENVINKALQDSKEGINWNTVDDSYFMHMLYYPYYLKNVGRFLELRKEQEKDNNDTTKQEI